MQFLTGLSLAALVGGLAWRAGALSTSGAWAAALTGGLIFGLGGLPWAALLLAFFVSSSLLSRVFGCRKANLEEKYAKGSRRDWSQVLANGGLGALLAIVFGLIPEGNWTWVAFVGAMAAVNADTWATELGVLSPVPPRLIAGGRVVEKGASGGVTLVGYLAAFAGAALIAVTALTFTAMQSPPGLLGRAVLALASAALVGGLAGASFDSLLGATVQAIYFCPSCGKETERHPRHTCGAETRLHRGWRWLNNDVVNFSCSLVGALAALLTWSLLA